MSLTEFLLARIAEDEHRAKQAWSVGYRGSRWLNEPDRQLAECEAKRAILDDHRVLMQMTNPPRVAGCDRCKVAGYCPTLCAMAAVYADRPDYREEWKP